jgi:MFS family permease
MKKEPSALLGQPIVTREFLLLAIANFLVANNFYTLLTVIPIYTLDVFRMKEAEAGFATGLFVAGMLCSRFIAGRLVARIGFRPLLIAGISGVIAFTFLYFPADTPILLYPVRLLNGFAYGLTSNTIVTLASTIIPRARSGEALGYFTMFPMAAWAVGPFVGVNFAAGQNYDSVFFYCALLPAVALILVLFLRIKGLRVGMEQDSETGIWREHIPREDERAGAAIKERFFDKFLERSTLPVTVTCVFVVLFHSAVMSFVAIYAETLGLSAAASLFFICYVIAILASRPFVSRLFDRKGANFTFVPGACIYVASFTLLALTQNGWMLILSAVLLGLGFGAVQSSTLALTVTRAPRQRLGMANATYFISLDLCSSIGPIIAGLLIPYFGYRGLYLIGAVYTMLSLPVYFKLLGQRKTRM